MNKSLLDGIFGVFIMLADVLSYVFSDILRAWCYILLFHNLLFGIACLAITVYLLDGLMCIVVCLGIVLIFTYSLIQIYVYTRPFL